MGKKPKPFRGVKKKEYSHIGCSCFLCVGHDRSNKYVQKEREMQKEIIENDFIYSVSKRCDICGSDDYHKFDNPSCECVPNK